MHEQGLGPHALDKPTGLEDGGKERLAARVQRAPGAAADGRADPEEQRRKGRQVKKRRHGPKAQHEAAKRACIPALRPADALFVHVVPGDRRAGQVVDEVKQQKLHRTHGQKRQERGRDQYRYDVREVGAHGHLDVLDHVGKSRATGLDAVLKHHEVLLQKDDVGGLARHVDGRVDRDAAVALAHGGRVVHAVAHVAHSVSALAQDAHHAGLLGRGELGEDAGLLHSLAQLGIVHCLDLKAGQDVGGVDADGAADVGGHAGRVAR